jgi:hypothetical protein
VKLPVASRTPPGAHNQGSDVAFCQSSSFVFNSKNMFYKQLNFKSIIIFRSKIFLDIINTVKFITAEKNFNQFNVAIHDLLLRMPQFAMPVTLEGKRMTMLVVTV